MTHRELSPQIFNTIFKQVLKTIKEPEYSVKTYTDYASDNFAKHFWRIDLLTPCQF